MDCVICKMPWLEQVCCILGKLAEWKKNNVNDLFLSSYNDEFKSYSVSFEYPIAIGMKC